MPPTRRQFVTALGAAAVGSSLATERVAADHAEAQPVHVDISYEPDVLDRYAPVVDIDLEDREKLRGLYGWVARSPEYETFTCCYFYKYTLQEGWIGPQDSHRGDHEPVQVEVDKTTGEVRRVRASIYHWLKGEVFADAVSFAENGTSPRLRVFNPYHHYTAAAPGASTERFDVRDLTEIYDAILANGLEGALAPGAFRNPWVMRNRADFWRRGVAGVRVDGLIVGALAAVGYGDIGTLEADS